jgi:hypothetical protein
VVSKDEDGGGRQKVSGDDKEDLEMEKMLSELTSIVPPSATPPDLSLSSGGQEEREEEESGSLDTLAIMRKRLEESVLDESTDNQGGEHSEDPKEKAPSLPSTIVILKESPERSGEGEKGREEEEELKAAINILPPTPTTIKETFGSGGVGPRDGASAGNMSSLSTRGLGGTAATVGKLGSPSPSLDISLSSREASKSEEDLSNQGSFFSPTSSRNSPDVKVSIMAFSPPALLLSSFPLTLSPSFLPPFLLLSLPLSFLPSLHLPSSLPPSLTFILKRHEPLRTLKEYSRRR